MKNQNGTAAFYTLLITQTLSLLGSRMSGFALGIWVYQQTGNATPLALVAFFEVVPMILLSNIAGMFADRFDRRKVMMIANLGQSIGSVLLIVSFASGNFQIWQLYGVAMLQAAFGAFLYPSFQASMTMLVSDKNRDRANAISQLSNPMAGVLAPGITGLLYAIVGVTGVLVIDLITFLVAAAATLWVNIPRPATSAEGKASRGSGLGELLGGFHYLASRRILIVLVLFASLINFAFNGVGAISTPYLMARTGDNTGLLGAILSVMNVGAILGGIIMGVWGGTRPRIHTALIGIIVASAALALFGVSRNPALLGLTLFMAMFPWPFVNAAFMSILQIKVPPDMQGRVFAVISQISMLLSPISLLLIGPLVDQVFEPAVKNPGWATFAPLVGDSRGAGMGLLTFGLGAALTIAAIAFYAVPAVRHVEADLPDYVAVPSDAPTEGIAGVPELSAAK